MCTYQPAQTALFSVRDIQNQRGFSPGAFVTSSDDGVPAMGYNHKGNGKEAAGAAGGKGAAALLS